MTTTTEPLERRWTHESREHLMRHDPLKGHAVQAHPGPWWDEPDKLQWVDPSTDLDCLMLRNRMGVWCGYVGLPPGHPWRAAGSYDEIPAEVHGGLTFGPAACDEDAPEGHGICHVPFPGRPADVAWIGFDCGHGFDYAPVMALLLDGLPEYTGPDTPRWLREVYRDEAYVRGECTSLAAQAAEAARRRTRHGYAKHARDERRHHQKELVRLLLRRDRSDIEEHLLRAWLSDRRRV